MLQAIGQNYIVKPVWEKEAGKLRFWVPERGIWAQYNGFVYGIIISTGPKCKLTYQDKPLQPGTKIIFLRHEGKPIKYDGELYYKMKERWVQAVIEETPALSTQTKSCKSCFNLLQKHGLLYCPIKKWEKIYYPSIGGNIQSKRHILTSDLKKFARGCEGYTTKRLKSIGLCVILLIEKSKGETIIDFLLGFPGFSSPLENYG